MTLPFVDRCIFQAAAGGTGDFVESAAITGFQTVAAAGGLDGQVLHYAAQSTDLTQWEVGIGTYATVGPTLSRDTVLYNNLGTTAKIAFSAAPQVLITALTQDFSTGAGPGGNPDDWQYNDGLGGFGGNPPAALTKTDDTNVTLTLGGSPATALLFATSVTVGWTGQLGLARGGTNADLSATGGAAQYLKQASAGAAITVGTIPASDIASGTALTRVDDTNVTLTLGGAPSTALLTATSLTLGWTGTLSLARGGTATALADPGLDLAMGWDDSAGVIKFMTLTDINTEASPVGGDYILIYDAAGNFLKTDWSNLPSSSPGGNEDDWQYNDGAGGFGGNPPAALTKTDDTNVTLTLGGSPSTALLFAASITVGWTGQLGLARGGTHADLSATGGAGQVLKQVSGGADITVATLAASDIASGAALTRVSDTNVTLTLGGSPTVALLAATSITVGWTGQLGLARGGTAADLSATGGTAQYLKQAGVGATITVGTIPASDIASGAALTKVDDTNVTLTLGGAPSTALLAATSLTLGWTGTLGLARGGTHANLGATGGAGQVLKQVSGGADITVATLTAAEIASGAALTRVDDTNVTLTLGGAPTTALLAAASITAGWTGTLSLARGGTGTTLVDPNLDQIVFWDDSASAIKFATLALLTTEASPAAGDYVLVQRAEDDIVKVNWSSLPGGTGITIASLAPFIHAGYGGV